MHEPDAAQKLLEQAIGNAPNAARPRIELAKLLGQRGDPAAALAVLEQIQSSRPAAVPLVANHLAQLGIASGQAARALDLLKAHYAESPCIDCLEAIVTLERHLGASPVAARQWYLRHLEREPSLVAASRWFAGETNRKRAASTRWCSARWNTPPSR